MQESEIARKGGRALVRPTEPRANTPPALATESARPEARDG